MEAYHTPSPDDKFAPARMAFETLVERLHGDDAHGMTHSELESMVSEQGRDVLRQLVQGHLELRALREPVREAVVGADGEARTQHRSLARPLLTTLGPVNVSRISYGAPGLRSLRPLDAELNLPTEHYSHGLRRLSALEATRGSFDGAVEAILRNTGNKVGKRQIEELVARAARDFDEFYSGGSAMAAEDTDLLVLSLDGKGIVMRRDALREATRKAADEGAHKLKRRLSRGEKKNRKRMATVSAVYDVVPFVRSAEDVMSDLKPARDARKARPRASNKRVWASVQKDAKDVTREVFEEALRRDPDQRRRWVVLVDGDRHQIRRVRAEAKRHGVEVTLVLDLIHVLEYLWKAAWCFFEEGDTGAEDWVRQRAVSILEGHSSDVAAGIRRSATLRKLSSRARKGADSCADYLLNKKSMLRYHEYLDAGLPIATGVIEGACRHLVADRMDITGARWGLEGAEAVLRLRSIISSGDFDDYWRFHLSQEHRRVHLSRYAEDEASKAA